jgi:hypothetical protein
LLLSPCTADDFIASQNLVVTQGSASAERQWTGLSTTQPPKSVNFDHEIVEIGLL